MFLKSFFCSARWWGSLLSRIWTHWSSTHIYRLGTNDIWVFLLTQANTRYHCIDTIAMSTSILSSLLESSYWQTHFSIVFILVDTLFNSLLTLHIRTQHLSSQYRTHLYLICPHSQINQQPVTSLHLCERSSLRRITRSDRHNNAAYSLQQTNKQTNKKERKKR